jgi:hypothetical protein
MNILELKMHKKIIKYHYIPKKRDLEAKDL